MSSEHLKCHSHKAIIHKVKKNIYSIIASIVNIISRQNCIKGNDNYIHNMGIRARADPELQAVGRQLT